MHKDEFLKAFIEKDAEKLRSFILSAQLPCIILSPSLPGNQEERVWLGDYLRLLAKERSDISKECYLFIFELKDRAGQTWPFYFKHQLHYRHSALIELLKHLVAKNILSPDEVLSIAFYIPPGMTEKHHLASREVKAGDPIPVQFITWLHAAKDKHARFAKAFLSLCIMKECTTIDSHYDKLIDLLERFQANPELSSMLFRFLLVPEVNFALDGTLLFVHLYLKVVTVNDLESRLCTFIYQFNRSQPLCLSILMTNFVANLGAMNPTNYLNELLNLKIGTPISSEVSVNVLRGHRESNVIEEASRLCGNSLYPLLLLMIKEAFIERSDQQVTQHVAHKWIELMFDHRNPHFPVMSHFTVKSAVLSGFVFDLLVHCKEKGYILTYFARPETNLLGVFNGGEVTFLKRFINLLMRSPNVEAYIENIVKRCAFSETPPEMLNRYCMALYILFSHHPSFLEHFVKSMSNADYPQVLNQLAICPRSSAADIVINDHPDWASDIDYEGGGNLYSILWLMIRQLLKGSRSKQVEAIAKGWLTLFVRSLRDMHIHSVKHEPLLNVMFEVFNMYGVWADSDLRFLLIRTFDSCCATPAFVRMVEKKLMESKFENFSVQDQTAIRLSTNAVAQYRVFKNDHRSNEFSLSAFPNWNALLDSLEDPMRGLLILEAALECFAFKIVSHPIFERLMQLQNVLGLLIKYRVKFTEDEYRLLLEGVVSLQETANQSPFVMLSLENEDMYHVERLISIYNCPILIRVNQVIKIYGFYNGAWGLAQLDINEFRSLSAKWRSTPLFIPAGDASITEGIYETITTSKGHDLNWNIAGLRLERALLAIDEGHFHAARACLGFIPIQRQCMSSDMQGQLVNAYLKLYESEKKLSDLLCALRHARLLPEKDRRPTAMKLLNQQENYFKQVKLLKELFDWDKPLKLKDDEIHAAAFNLQCTFLAKLESDSGLEGELIEHARRILRWLADDPEASSLKKDLEHYKNKAPKKWGLLEWMRGPDILVTATEKLYEALLRLKAKNQFTEGSLPDPKGETSSAWAPASRNS